MDDNPLILDLNEDADANVWVRLFVTELIDRHGGAVSAILLYGSHLRGKRDTVLDFYILLNDYAQGITGVFTPWGFYPLVSETWPDRLGGVVKNYKILNKNVKIFARRRRAKIFRV